MKKQTLLIVDDEMVFVQSLKSHFLQTENKPAKYKVLTASNGIEALEIIRKEKIDLVILDINMPVLDGIEVLVELHNRSIWLPVVVLTSVLVMSQNEHQGIFEEYGIIDYLEKPVNLDKLNQTVAEVLERFFEYDHQSSGIGLPTILRVIESEKRSGVLTVEFDDGNGRIFFRDGAIIDAESMGLPAESALIKCISMKPRQDKISVEYVHHERDQKISKPLAEILQEIKA